MTDGPKFQVDQTPLEAELGSPSAIYLLPGLRGRLDRGLGAALLDRDLQVTGRETVGAFDSLPFQDQVAIVANDLRQYFWHPQARVIGNSFGAYLFLHAQSQLPPFPGRVLLLSPLLGEGTNATTGQSFQSPGVERLNRYLASDQCLLPTHLDIHVGEHDWQASPERWQALAPLLGFTVHTVANGGHRLDPAYVTAVLDQWL